MLSGPRGIVLSICIFIILCEAIAETGATPDFARVPLAFEVNRGQAAAEVRYLARGAGYSLLLTKAEAVIAGPRGPALRMRFAGGAKRDARIEGLDEQRGRANYLIGTDRAQWHTGIPTFASVRYESVYPGIDLVFYGTQRQLEYDFIAAPGAEPRAIELRFDGHRSLAIDRAGDLVVRGSGVDLRQGRPVIYQDTGAGRRYIAGSYRLRGSNRVGFDIGAYDRAQPLVIDPILAYSSYIGGSGGDLGVGIAVDATGHMYIAGNTSMAGFPHTDSLADAPNRRGTPIFITKLTPSGSAVVYSTFVNLGIASFDNARAIAVDAAGNPHVVGASDACQADYAGFALKLNATGSGLVYRHCLEGARGDTANAIALDAAGNAYVTGRWNVCSNHCAFVASFDPAGMRRFGVSLHDGTSRSGHGRGIAADAAGNAYIVGQGYVRTTEGAFQGTVRGGEDIFVAKLDRAGQVLYATYVGGSDIEVPGDIAPDEAGNAWVAGETRSSDFPLAGPRRGSRDAFVAKLNANGSALLFSTLLGGGGEDFATAIAPDGDGGVFIAGSTNSSDFPVRDAIQPALASGTCRQAGVAAPCPDAFITRLSRSGAVIFSTYLGGSGVENVGSIAIGASTPARATPARPGDPGGGRALYISGTTTSANFPTVRALRSSFAGPPSDDFYASRGDVFVVRIAEGSQPAVRAVVNAASFAPGVAVAPGSIVSLFGEGLTGSALAASTMPLPITLSGVTVMFNGVAAPLFYLGPGQINLQIPWEVAGTQAHVTVETSTAVSEMTLPVAAHAPGLFSAGASGSGQGAVLISSTTSLAAPAATWPGPRPARRGEYIQIYGAGLGPVSNPPPTGAPAPHAPLSELLTSPVVTIGGLIAAVSFAGLAPGFVGLYQVNAEVPAAATAGDAVPLVLSVGGVSSNTVTIAVE